MWRKQRYNIKIQRDTAVGEYSKEECPRRQEKRKKRKMNNGDRSNVEISGRC